MPGILHAHSLPRTLAIAVALLCLGLAAWPDWWMSWLEESGLRAHGSDSEWTPALIALHVLPEFLIGLSFIAISATLAYLVRRAWREIPFSWVFLAFGGFIVTCGVTHFLDILGVWVPIFFASGMVKVVTAVASVSTAALLPPLIPNVLALVQAKKVSDERGQSLESAHAELQTLYARVKDLDLLKTQFFANVSHELRTPLMLILGPIRKLRERAALGPELEHDLEVAERNARTLQRHVNDLLDVAKLDAGKMRVDYAEVDLAFLVRYAAGHFENFARERHIDFTVEAPGEAPAHADPEKIQRVLLNLLSNAFKYTPDGGKVRCRLRTDLTRAVLMVDDSGPGVKPEMRLSIFEQFRQADQGMARSYGGTGLGLSIAREFVELHGGRILVEDGPAGGAQFVMELPRTAPTGTEVRRTPYEGGEGGSDLFRQVVQDLRTERIAAQPRPAKAPESPSGGTPLVLIVEDNREMNLFVSDALKPEFRPMSAYDGREGLDLALAHKPDLILCDVMLPGMGGDRLVEELRKVPELENHPVLLLTALADDETRVRLLRAGAQDYLVKPFSLDELRLRARNLVAMKRAREILQREVANRREDLSALALELAERNREVQAALERAESAGRAKDEFLMTLSHELRTPLNAILGWASLMRTRKLASEQVEQALDTIERNGRAQLRLITDLLDLSSILSGKMRMMARPVHLASVVQGAVESLRLAAEGKAITLVSRIEDATGFVTGDADRLQQAVWNLLSNAIKFTPRDGRVDVEIRREDGQLAVSVSDTGEGIDPGFVPMLFERFRQADSSTMRRHGGLGLGLAIVKHIVELHGGTVEAVSAGEGQGASFRIRLPVAAIVVPAVASSEGGSPLMEDRPLAGLRILAVDDEPDARSLLIAALQQHGAEVQAVPTARDALHALEDFLPNVLIADIGMPELDGYDLIRHIRKRDADRGGRIPALALTAYAGEEQRTRALIAGFQMHVAKPVAPAELVAAIAGLAGRG